VNGPSLGRLVGFLWRRLNAVSWDAISGAVLALNISPASFAAARKRDDIENRSASKMSADHRIQI